MQEMGQKIKLKKWRKWPYRLAAICSWKSDCSRRFDPKKRLVAGKAANINLAINHPLFQAKFLDWRSPSKAQELLDFQLRIGAIDLKLLRSVTFTINREECLDEEGVRRRFGESERGLKKEEERGRERERVWTEILFSSSFHFTLFDWKVKGDELLFCWRYKHCSLLK